MHQASRAQRFDYHYQPTLNDDHIICDWDALRTQLLYQWQKLTPAEVDNIGPNRRRIAQLVQSKYGVASLSVENYLRNFERTLPL